MIVGLWVVLAAPLFGLTVARVAVVVVAVVVRAVRSCTGCPSYPSSSSGCQGYGEICIDKEVEEHKHIIVLTFEFYEHLYISWLISIYKRLLEKCNPLLFCFVFFFSIQIFATGSMLQNKEKTQKLHTFNLKYILKHYENSELH